MTISVLVTAYEQERYVETALLSVLGQRVSSPLEILVGVDRSGDGTEERVRELERSHPGRLRLFSRSQRLGLVENFRRLYREARGDYVALLEGDDYWTDPEKLSRQLRILEEEPQVVFCGHRVDQVSEDGRELGPVPGRPFSVRPTSVEFVARFCDMHTSSLVFRDVFGGELPPEVLDERLGLVDLPLKLALAARGGIAYLPEAMSVFRRVEGSASSAIDDEGWRDIIVRALANVDPVMTPELRRITRRLRIDLLVSGATSRRRSRFSRAICAVRGLLLGPRRAAVGLARGSYADLPEGAQQLYRRVRGAVRSQAGATREEKAE